MKKSRQSDVVERLKPPVPERPKLVSRNLQTKDVLDENLKEENRERNDEEDISGEEVLCYAWQIAKGMVRTFSTEECFEQFSHRLQITRICLFPLLIL